MADLVIAEEPVDSAFIAGAENILHEHYRRTATKIDIPPLDYNWELYSTIADSGMFVCFSARENGVMLGFAMYFIAKHPHHKNDTWATCDGLCVAVDARGRGIGRKLLEFAETELGKRGAVRLVQFHRAWHQGLSLYEKQGFTPTERAFYKDLTGTYPLATWETQGDLAKGEFYDDYKTSATPG